PRLPGRSAVRHERIEDPRRARRVEDIRKVRGAGNGQKILALGQPGEQDRVAEQDTEADGRLDVVESRIVAGEANRRRVARVETEQGEGRVKRRADAAG